MVLRCSSKEGVSLHFTAHVGTKDSELWTPTLDSACHALYSIRISSILPYHQELYFVLFLILFPG